MISDTNCCAKCSKPLTIHEQRLGLFNCQACCKAIVEHQRREGLAEKLAVANQKAFRFERFDGAFRKMVNL